MNGNRKIKHNSHPHPLHLRSIKDLYKCDGCHQQGFDLCYCCKEKNCHFHLHEGCATSSEDDSCIGDHDHALLHKHVLRYRERKPSKVRPCIACGKAVSGFRYKTWHKKAQNSRNPFWLVYQHFTQKALHPRCKELSNRLGQGELILGLRMKAPTKCQICDHNRLPSGTEGWAYVSSCGNYCYHMGCVIKIMEENWQKQCLDRKMKKRKGMFNVCARIARLAFALIIDAFLGAGAMSVFEFSVNVFFE